MANKKLVVVESPAKAKTINKYLGKNFVVEASVGHIKDLVKFRLGVDIDNGYEPKYITIRGKAPVIKKLKQLAGSSNEVLIATDPDREGEAIAWHIYQEVLEKNENVKRVLFNEITKNGVKEGIANPQEIDKNLFMSQQARRVMDRLIGYKVSPFLSRAMIEKTTEALSAGRVQSVALRLICERDSEIAAFSAIEYWNIAGDFSGEQGELKARLVAFDGDNIKNPEGSGDSPDEKEREKIRKKLESLHYIRNEKEANDLISRIEKQEFAISSINRKKVKRRPQPPFTTSLLQQEASRRLGYSNKKTMMLAQRLYEGVTMGDEGAVGLITYMRTDSMRISPQAMDQAKDFIKNNYSDVFLPDKPNVYKSKSSNVQDAHEAIRPTSMEFTPKEVRKYLGRDETRLYELIFNRFLASQMAPAVIDQTTVEISGGEFVFRVSGSVIAFKGFLIAYEDIKDEKSNGSDEPSNLPSGLKESQKMALQNAGGSQSFTKPPSRYTESSLVKELDEKGIGRPSTYAQIVSTLLDRNYVELKSKSFEPTELGRDVNDVLIKNFPALFTIDFTAKMEENLDTVAEGSKSYIDVMDGFYEPFSKSLQHAEEHADIPEILCEECDAPMVIRVSRRGRFLGCSKYPDCTFTKPLPKGEKDKPKPEPVLVEDVKCDECGKPMLLRESRYGKFYGCQDYPKCKGTKPFTIPVKCPKCGEGEIVERYSKKSRKKFYGCSNFPKCDYITNYEPVDKKCASCGHAYLEVRFRKNENGYEKYLRCPGCKGTYEMKQ
ncbi:MAG: type I DNA topoisomerase [Candidatus Kapaibacterium sp.]